MNVNFITNYCSPNQCENDGICVDEPNTFACNCIAGYAGDLCQTSRFIAKSMFDLMKMKIILKAAIH